MTTDFIPDGTVAREVLDGRTLEWLSVPSLTGAESLVVLRIAMPGGGGHTFHRHPDQEEFLYVIDGTLEQWAHDERRILEAGDACFIPRDTVHASFNASPEREAVLLAILGPSVGESGATMIEVGDQEPWASLR